MCTDAGVTPESQRVMQKATQKITASWRVRSGRRAHRGERGRLRPCPREQRPTHVGSSSLKLRKPGTVAHESNVYSTHAVE
eukprot:3397189-Alexandrium_andersonii.AAC.1